jgi:RNA polymerase sigma-32 factor
MAITRVKQLDPLGGVLGSLRPGSAAPKVLLDRDEERELARRAGAGDVTAEQRLIASLQGFVVRTAKAYRRSGVPMSDLVQEGMVGLIQAVRRFNPEKDVRLATYAVWWIRAAMLDHIVRSWSIVRLSTTSAQKSLFLQLRRLSGLIGSADALSEDIIQKLADRFETTAADVRALARRVTHRDTSLDQAIVVHDGSTTTWLDQLRTDEPTAEEKLVMDSERRLTAELTAVALAHLPAREQFIIRNRYFSGAKRTLASIGHELNLSKDRVRQLEARALSTLREILGQGLAQHR